MFLYSVVRKFGKFVYRQYGSHPYFRATVRVDLSLRSPTLSPLSPRPVPFTPIRYEQACDHDSRSHRIGPEGPSCSSPGRLSSRANTCPDHLAPPDPAALYRLTSSQRARLHIHSSSDSVPVGSPDQGSARRIPLVREMNLLIR